MLYPTTVFAEEDRDPDGLYQIGSGHQHIFPFTVPFMGRQTILMKHALVNSQDFSISVWFSEAPGDKVIFSMDDSWDIFTLSRGERSFDIWSHGDAPTPESKQLDPGKTYYVNLHNLQNRPNGYQLTFSFLTI